LIRFLYLKTLIKLFITLFINFLPILLKKINGINSDKKLEKKYPISKKYINIVEITIKDE
jgi:hypothetical protein